MSWWLEALWLFLPAGLANMAPVIGNKIPGWNQWQTPLDFGHSYKGRRIFGPNKTWRGLVFGMLVAGLAGFGQSQLSFHPYEAGTSVMIGVLLGLGAIYGDATESFFKRQYDVEAGHSWFPFDQLDYIVGALAATAPLLLFGWEEVVLIIAVYFGLHLVVAYIGYLLKLKDKPI